MNYADIARNERALNIAERYSIEAKPRDTLKRLCWPNAGSDITHEMLVACARNRVTLGVLSMDEVGAA